MQLEGFVDSLGTPVEQQGKHLSTVQRLLAAGISHEEDPWLATQLCSDLTLDIEHLQQVTV